MGIDELYNDLLELNDLCESEQGNLTVRIQNILIDFLKDKKNPAVWCNGGHTRVLFADFVFELKKVKLIIDKNKEQKSRGYKIILPESIGDYDIDGIIISSFRYRNEIADEIRKEYPDIPFLDIYEELEKQGIVLDNEYFWIDHPLRKYHEISEILVRLKNNDYSDTADLQKLIDKLIGIKDMRLAGTWADKLFDISPNDHNKIQCELLKKIYKEELRLASEISKNNVLMMLCDGMRRRDIINGCAPGLKSWLESETEFFDNAYSVSTSTYESLIPVYSENFDLRTRYYESNTIKEGGCRFINEAKKEKRDIIFVTDGFRYVDDMSIELAGGMRTLSEKIWYFVKIANTTDNGFFYIHELDETHYAFQNPYTEEVYRGEDGETIYLNILNSSNIPLAQRRVSIDFKKWQMDGLKYVDDTLTPFLNCFKFQILFLADHGCYIYSKGEKFMDVLDDNFSYGDEAIEIPFAIKSEKVKCGINHNLISQNQVNNILVALMRNEKYTEPDVEYVKSQRSEIYNPNIKKLMIDSGRSQELNAFERFTFRDGDSLIIYGNHKVKYHGSNASMNRVRNMLNAVSDDLTVCSPSEINLDIDFLGVY